MSKPVSSLLPQVALCILLALSLKPRHGYELMRQIHDDTDGRIRLGPGALYGALKTLSADGFIEEMPFEGDPRRRYYRLTRKGWQRLGQELTYYKHVVAVAHSRHLLADNGL